MSNEKKTITVELTETTLSENGTAITRRVVTEGHVNEVLRVETPLVTVRADMLIPFLVYARKFFKKIVQTDRNVASRFVDPEDFELLVALKGFTPEDFNALQSLNNSIGTELVKLLDEAGENTPQMKRTNEFGSVKSQSRRMYGNRQAGGGERSLGDGEGAASGVPRLSDGKDVDPKEPDR